MTWVSVMQPHRPAEIAKDNDAKHDRALDSLSSLSVPDATASAPKPDSVRPTQPPVPSPEIADSKTTLSNGSSLATDSSKDDAASGSLLLGLDLGDSKSGNKNDAVPTASVQLGTPVPVSLSAPSLADRSRSGSSGSLPLTTPRYETVSGPGNTKSVMDKTSLEATGNTTPNSNSPTLTPSSSGASPSTWDGAKTMAEPDRNLGNGLTISKPVSSEITLSSSQDGMTFPATRPTPSVGGSTTSPVAAPTTPEEVANSFLISQKNGASATMAPPTLGGPSNTTTASSGATAATRPAAMSNDSPGVTVGGGFKEPGNLAHSTSSPDLDAAALAQQWIEVAKQKSLAASESAAAPAGPINSYMAGPPSRPNIPGATNSYVQGANPATSSTTMPANYPNSGPINSYAQVTGGTGANATPYVRNAPNNSTMPANTLASGPTSAPTGLAAYNLNTQGSGMTSQQPGTMQQQACNSRACNNRACNNRACNNRACNKTRCSLRACRI